MTLSDDDKTLIGFIKSQLRYMTFINDKLQIDHNIIVSRSGNMCRISAQCTLFSLLFNNSGTQFRLSI